MAIPFLNQSIFFLVLSQHFVVVVAVTFCFCLFVVAFVVVVGFRFFLHFCLFLLSFYTFGRLPVGGSADRFVPEDKKSA